MHVTSLYKPDRVGGAELFVESLAQQQVANGDAVAIAVVSRSAEPAIDEAGVSVYRMGHTTPFFIMDWATQPNWKRKYYKVAVQFGIGMLERLENAIRDFQPDVVNTHSLSELSPLIWPAVAKHGIPVVHTLHDFTSMCTNGSLYHDGHICGGQSSRCRVFAWYHRRHQRSVSAVTGVGSDVLARHLNAGFFHHVDPDLRRVIWNPVDTPKKSRVRLKPQKDEPVVFGYLARLEEAKGADVVLSALSHLPSSGWRMIMAGQSPSNKADYLNRSRGLPVEFPGYVNSNTFFNEIDCLIAAPVWPEAFGRTVAEAYLHGIPVIGSNLGGVAEQVKANHGGQLFEPGNAPALAALMRDFIIDHERLTLDTSLLHEFAARITPANVAKQYSDLYAKTCQS